MAATHRLFDHVVFALLLIAPLIEWRWSWPRYLRRLAAGDRGARKQHYYTLIFVQWLLTLTLATVWVRWDRPWADLMMNVSITVWTGVGLAGAMIVAGLLVVQRHMILVREATVKRVRLAMAYAEPLLPQSATERRLFWVVSFTAGVCEEIFYRGFLTWYLAGWIGLTLAVFLSAAIFGFGHLYLGAGHVPRTFLIGLVFGGVTVASGSLLPAMVLHAAMDWNSGELGYRLLSCLPEEGGAAAAT
jgi:uncharacterized protein